MHPETIYPRTGDQHTVYLKSVITDPGISVGDFTMYNDFVHDPRDFEKNNVLYHYPVNRDRLVIGRFCSIACGAKFLFTSANHTLSSLSTYPFPLFFEEWGLDVRDVATAWDNKGDIVIGHDVWIGYEAVILSGVTIDDGAIIGTRAVVTRDGLTAEQAEARMKQQFDYDGPLPDGCLAIENDGDEAALREKVNDVLEALKEHGLL